MRTQAREPGRDFLIGGAGADLILGNADEDLLIAGTTRYDGLDCALIFLLAEWTSAGTYSSRVANITAGTGLTNGFRLDGGGAQIAPRPDALST